MDQPVSPLFRFAPSPNGALHLGHAHSALVNRDWADALGRDQESQLLLRMEDIDTTRCTPSLADGMRGDLHWLGVTFDGEVEPQSQRFAAYQKALERLQDIGLVYASFMSRGEIKQAVAGKPDWPRDPDGSPHYPGDERSWKEEERQAQIDLGKRVVWRLDMAKAVAWAGRLVWTELANPSDAGTAIEAQPERWGDVVLARADVPTSYHLSVTVDDAAQGITHVVRGEDLRAATGVHRLLQHLLGLPVPLYHHHGLVLGDDGRKLSKSDGSTSLAALRESGVTPDGIRQQLDRLRAHP
ncbi:tRNA glutamyl-Q(34) synthetase GluQRS [Ahrensia sp. R2A130]|uniref:tRNA glutamyl-Q(34) synthetase GluQRS n=1 Tax=Ahrensia sp. R2A130 TaxID=744979 RepID=UPI0001E0F101|nr:tRNA glutamyl-Q(34) synthetase GluQRS [Ahrensia sp. R2A130]EFL88038.1 glutamyl-Q tRNA(Asp) synthetase [Ahrensia sp. R2A130]